MLIIDYWLLGVVVVVVVLDCGNIAGRAEVVGLSAGRRRCPWSPASVHAPFDRSCPAILVLTLLLHAYISILTHDPFF